eukprot:15100603-Alexandrium_andersonii.AAC.1
MAMPRAESMWQQPHRPAPKDPRHAGRGHKKEAHPRQRARPTAREARPPAGEAGATTKPNATLPPPL